MLNQDTTCGICKWLSYLIFCLPLIGIGQDAAIERLDQKLDSLISIGMDSLAFPGAQILVRHRDTIIYHKAWGHHTYDRIQRVLISDIYDLASVTKVSTGLPVLMRLHGAGLLDLDAPVKTYFKTLKKSNKKDVSLRQVLAHQAGIEPYVVFYQKAKKKNGRYKRGTFRNKPSRKFSIKITDSLFLSRKYYRKMKKEIRKTPLSRVNRYRYSGLAFLLMPEMIADMINQPFERYLYDKIYKPIGATHLVYNPLDRYNKSCIIPTEYDSLWRHQLVHGTVHDEAAAMLGGVSCNAGLFGDAESLSRLFQLYLNEGAWKGKEIIPANTVRTFTAYQYPESRRGLGFDKPLREYDKDRAYVAESASTESYGHSGFTGTMIWADPRYDLVFVFLSNRVYPSRDHRKLYQLSLRPQMHQAVYDYIHSIRKEEP